MQAITIGVSYSQESPVFQILASPSVAYDQKRKHQNGEMNFDETIN
jgi:hypothetical protein